MWQVIPHSTPSALLVRRCRAVIKQKIERSKDRNVSNARQAFKLLMLKSIVCFHYNRKCLVHCSTDNIWHYGIILRLNVWYIFQATTLNTFGTRTNLTENVTVLHNAEHIWIQQWSLCFIVLTYVGNLSPLTQTFLEKCVVLQGKKTEIVSKFDL